MFDENFSFLSSSSTFIPQPEQYSSAEISPCGSRSSSPRPSHRCRQGSSSQPISHRDTRFDAHRRRNPSISALAAQLESHALISETSSPASPTATATPSDTSLDTDEGFFEGPGTPASTATDYSSEFDPSLWDLTMTDLNATSSPRPSMSLEAQAMSSYTLRRRQRQALVRLQCLAKRAPDLAMLIEECHPSSFPLSQDSIWSGASRSGSTSGASSGRVDKERSGVTLVRKIPRSRRRTART